MDEQLKIIISAEIGKLKQGVADAKSEMEGFKSQVSKASADVDKNIKALGKGIAAGLKIGMAAVAAMATALIGISAATEEYRENQAKLVTAFETAGASASTAKGVYNDLYRVLGEDDTAVEAANHLAKLTTNEKELEQWTTICTGVYATFGDSLPIEGLTEAANETAKTGVVTGSLADALNWAGISEDEFNAKLAACNSEAEREQLIRTTLNGVYSSAAANYEKNNKALLKQREAQAQLNETLAKVGAAVTPVKTAFIELLNDALIAIEPILVNFSSTVLPAIQSALEVVGSVLVTIGEWIVNHTGLLAAIAAIITTITIAVGLYTAAQAIQVAMNAAEVTSLGALIAAKLASAAATLVALAPYLLIAAAIVALIAVIVLCIKNWDKIKETVVKVATAIKEKISEMVDKVTTFFQNMKDGISQKVEAIKTAVREKFEAIKTAIKEKIQSAKETVLNIFTSIKTGISDKITAIKTAVSDKFEGIKSTIKSKISSAKESALSIFGSIKSGITEKINGAKNAVKNAIDKIKGFFKFSWSLPKLKLPRINISGKFSLTPPQAPKFSISWNKLGGVFDKPTLFNYGGSLQGIGEDGAEAVVPLEKNTKWLDRLATMLAEKSGGSRPILLQVDGKTFAQISIDCINDLTKQTGNLPLKLV